MNHTSHICIDQVSFKSIWLSPITSWVNLLLYMLTKSAQMTLMQVLPDPGLCCLTQSINRPHELRVMPFKDWHGWDRIYPASSVRFRPAAKKPAENTNRKSSNCDWWVLDQSCSGLVIFFMWQTDLVFLPPFFYPGRIWLGWDLMCLPTSSQTLARAPHEQMQPSRHMIK